VLIVESNLFKDLELFILLSKQAVTVTVVQQCKLGVIYNLKPMLLDIYVLPRQSTVLKVIQFRSPSII
jgi:hypothetical protein